jgi:adenylate cyclase
LNYLACVEGKFEEAEKHGQIAIKLEPLSSICYATYSLILHCSGKFNEALAVCKTSIELDANSFLCHANTGRIQMALQCYDEAISSFESAMKLTNRHPFMVNGLIWIYCKSGHHDKARKLMDELKERSSTEYVAKTFTGLSAAYLGDLDEAFEYLETAYSDRDPIFIMLKYERCVPDILRNDPRFQKLLERVGFPG